MRFTRVLPALALALGGCGGGTPTPATSSGGAARADKPWVVVVPGSATPSPPPTAGGSPRAALPPVSFLPTQSSVCLQAWPDTVGQVMIPMIVTPGSGSLTVTWPNRFGDTYRLAAVPQSLVTGAQPEPPWKTVTGFGECELTTTLTGLKSGEAYIVWLDAPNTPRDVDGTRGLYTGRSAVIKPN